MKLIDISELPNFEVKCSDGKQYVLLPFEHLSDIPVVDAEPIRHGEWIAKKIDGTTTLFICSNCHREIEICNDYFGKPTEHAAAIYPYCHCGTKMNT